MGKNSEDIKDAAKATATVFGTAAVGAVLVAAPPVAILAAACSLFFFGAASSEMGANDVGDISKGIAKATFVDQTNNNAIKVADEVYERVK